ncbi:hypothetical protein A0J61_10331 [Choanephora cucurbitarum]|uniref:Reverse transcriptase/retrotransposon-derived protein RNase H-like domain-containing protein n=1 Tax=Choanephora cucurbitarum TaxID=101091 RepID=A0A1C7MXR9_9FUNG|nr:hypothetical protein A0J61_10331 [Choanephora cucurbitarum]
MAFPNSLCVPDTPTAEEAESILASPLTAEEEMKTDALPPSMVEASTHVPAIDADECACLPAPGTPVTPVASGVAGASDDLPGLQDSFIQLKNEVDMLARKLTKGKSKYMNAIRYAFEARSKDLANLAKLRELFPSNSSHVVKPVAVSSPIPQGRLAGCPKNVSYFQWTGCIVFAPKESVYSDIGTYLNEFEDVMLCYDLNFDDNWYRLIVTRIDSDQRIWLSQFVYGSDEFKTALIRKYRMTSDDSKLQAHKEFSKIRFNHKQDTIEHFIDKFNTLRIKSAVRDSHVLANYFLKALLADLVDRIGDPLESVSTEKKTSLEYVFSRVRNLFNQALSNRDANTESKRNIMPSTQVQENGDSSNHKCVRFSRPVTGTSTPIDKPRPGKYCSFHRVTTHSTDECEARKRGEQPKAKSSCRRCGAPGWNPSHRCGTAVLSTPSNKNVTVRAPSAKNGTVAWVQLAGYLGFVSYFCSSNSFYSKLSSPLDALRSHKQLKGVWIEQHTKAYNDLKFALANTRVISAPDMSHHFHVATDASANGIGSILYQVIDNEVKYIAMVSHKSSPSERNYSTTKRELLAVVYSLMALSYSIYFTHHKSLIFFNTRALPLALMLGWWETIFPYTFVCVYQPGITNIIPDALSRLCSDKEIPVLLEGVVVLM